MSYFSKGRMVWFGMGILAAAGLLLLFETPFWSVLFSTGDFMPHSHCYLLDKRMIWLHLTSDSLIGSAYVVISMTLGYLVWKASKDIPFHSMLLAFGLFIIACGFTHFMEVWTLWHPHYWLAGGVKLVTAAASVVTAFLLPPLVPKALEMIRAAKISNERKKRLEQANAELADLYRRQTELDQIKTQFFANVSHELRTPLTLILGPVERMISQTASLSPEYQSDVLLIQRNARLLLRHINDLLDTSKLDAGAMEVNYRSIDLAQLVRMSASYFEGVAHDRKIDFKVEAPKKVPAEVDPEKVERILVNLFSNAFKFAPDNGKVECLLRVEGKEAFLTVHDNGPGVPQEMQRAIFERFRQVDGGATRKKGGTGLGLAIVKSFTELHRGRVEMENRPEGGAAFRVVLPLQALEERKVAVEPIGESTLNVSLQAAEELRIPAPAQASSAPAESENKEGVILIVEDNPEMNRFVADSLSGKYRTISAFNGNEGFNKALELKPDLILSDVMMPQMSGEQLLHSVRSCRELDFTPVLLLTAKVDEEVRVKLLREGAQDYLQKPFSVEELNVRVGNHIRIKKAGELLRTELASQSQDLVALTKDLTSRKQELQVAMALLKESSSHVQEVNNELERRVQARTVELQQTNSELEAFSFSVSHDLRAPLRAVSGFSRMLIEDYAEDLDEEGQDLVNRIYASAQKMDQLIHDLLAFARVGRSELSMRALDLNELVRSVVAELKGLGVVENADIRVDLLEAARGDSNLIRQVFFNLISNACKFSKAAAQPKIQICSEVKGEETIYYVRDNGVGFDPDYASRLFGVFQRLHSAELFEGTGLGLAIVQRIVTRHGGHAWAEGKPGQGATFYVSLPRQNGT